MVLVKWFKTFGATLMCVAVATAANAQSLSIPVGRSELVEVPVQMGEVIVANPDVADIYVHGKKKVSVMGKELGRTTVKIFDAKHRLVRNIDVSIGYDLPSIRHALKEFLPYESVDVKMVNANIAVVGEVTSAAAADRAVRIVEEFVTPAVGPKKKSGGNSDGLTENPKILNLLTVTAGQQVMLRVRVGEIRRTALKRLGMNLQAMKTGGSSIFKIGSGTGLDLFGTAAGSGTLGRFSGIGSQVNTAIGAGRITGSGGVAGILEALESNGLFKTLAEPNLVAMSGEEAQFLAGGEFPIPVAQDLGQIYIEYKPFGVSVNFKPLVLSENRIRIAVEPEVSEIDSDSAIQVSGFTIPSLRTRRVKTTIELAPGESFMIAGLIQDNAVSSIEQLPGVGEIPILSALMRSTEFQREETELVIAVTPYLVDPMTSNDVRLPTDDYRPASVMESFFYGALGSLSDGARRVSQTPSLEGPVGFLVD